MAATTKKVIWDSLTRIKPEAHQLNYKSVENSSGNIENLVYISVHTAHEVMMDHYPEYTWAFAEDDQRRECHYFNDGTAEVRVSMTIDGHTIYTSLNVTNSKGMDTKTPSARDIHNTKQRCRVKAMGEFGLFYSLWLYPDQFIKPDGTEDKHAPVLNMVKTAPVVMTNELDRYWPTVDEAQNKAAAEKAKQQIENQLRLQKGVATFNEDDIKNRWIATCTKRGWKA